jgi:hypothetical protein
MRRLGIVAVGLALVVAMVFALPYPDTGLGFAHTYTHPTSGNTTHLHIDADISNGIRPCDPIDATGTVVVGAVHKVGVCIEDYAGHNVAAFELHVHYTGDPSDNNPPQLNLATEIADPPSSPLLDNNPDANDGDDNVSHLRLGAGWDCSGSGTVAPLGEDPATVGVADAFIHCNADPIYLDVDLAANPGLLATIEFTATAVGDDMIDFGPIDALNANVVQAPYGEIIGSCGTAVAPQMGCFGAVIHKVLAVGGIAELPAVAGPSGTSGMGSATYAVLAGAAAAVLAFAVLATLSVKRWRVR